jgi:phytanoyl-CoA hydroxylase
MDVKKHKHEYWTYGYTIIKGLYSKAEVQTLKKEYENIWLEKVADGEIVQDQSKPLVSLYPRQKDLHFNNKNILEFALNEKALNMLCEFVDEDVDLISTNYYYKPPGMEGMPFHQDNYGIGVSPNTCHAIWTCLDSTDEKNGGMRFVPTTHQLELLIPKKVYDESADTFGGYVQYLEVPEGYEIITLKTEPGDAVIYHGNVIHDSTPNESETAFRNSIICHYAGVGTKKVTLNYNKLLTRKGEKIRKRPNLSSLQK